MELAGIAHVALPVSSLEKSLSFYRGVLGLGEADRPDFGFPGAWLIVGPNQVHLMEMGPVTPDQRQHFAIEVADAESVAIELESHGVKAHRSYSIPEAGQQVFINDPDGHQIEFNQPLRRGAR
jgi:catechol 2,3-dioxygenase-like lactoylglutathione lyase family enzyme